MRKTIYLAICLLAALSAQAREKVIDTPYWLYAQGMNLQYVTLSDTATMLSFHMYHPEGWNLSSGCHLMAGGKTLKARSARRYFMTKKGPVAAPFTFDNTGKYSNEDLAKNPYPSDSLVVSFEPLPRGTQAFDFEEDNNPKGWKMWGIRTVGKPYPELMKESNANDATATLPPYEPKAAMAVLKGHIYGYDKSKNMSYFYYDYNNPLTQEMDLKVTIDSTGDYRVQTMAYYPIHPHFALPGQTFSTVLIPGETTTLDVDVATLTGRGIEGDRWYRKPQIKARGYNAGGRFGALLQALKERKWRPTYVDSLKRDTALTLEEYTARQWRTYQDDMALLAKKKDYSPMQRDFMRLTYEYTYATKRIDYANYISSAYYFKTNNESIADIEKGKAMARFTLKDPHARELTLFNDMRAAYVIENTSLMPYMEANGLSDNEVYRWMADLGRAQNMASRISTLQPVTDVAAWDSIAPCYLLSLKQMNDTALALSARQKAMQTEDVQICDATTLNGPDILADITGKYKGKVVLIDCWATWCGPCRRGIEMMKPMEKELAGKDYVTVFLTDKSSPMKMWTDMIATMPGAHYRLTDEQWLKLPDMNGIPHYWLFGKDGTKLMDETGWDDKMLKTFQETIDKALK